MTKRRVEREIERLSEELLPTLSPRDRIRYLLEASIQNRERWIDRLYETCPPDQLPTIMAGRQLLLNWAREAAYDLHTIALRVELLQTKQDARIVIDRYRDESPSDEELERAATRADTIRAQFASLYIAYHGHRRFAREELGVALETWLRLHKNGPEILEVATSVLDDPTEERLAGEWLADDDESIDDPSAALDTYVDRWYETRVEWWTELVGTDHGRR